MCMDKVDLIIISRGFINFGIFFFYLFFSTFILNNSGLKSILPVNALRLFRFISIRRSISTENDFSVLK